MEQLHLATLVASIDSQLASEQLERVSHKSERGFTVLLVSALTLFALAIDGYHPYAEDGGLYMAGVKRLLDPALYPHGTAFVLEPARLSLFAPTVAALVRLSHLGLPLVLLALHLVSVWATLFAAWMLASRCWRWRSARAGAVLLLACWLVLPVAGTALTLMDPYLTARSFSTPCMVLALVAVLDMTERSRTPDGRRRGLLLWAASIALAAAMHPLMAAYALGATLMLICMRSPSRSVRAWGTVTFAVAALALAACLQLIANPESAAYLRIAMTRTYWFPAQWRWYELVGLAAPLAILTLFACAGHRDAAGADAPQPALSSSKGLAPEMWDRAAVDSTLRTPAAALARMAVAVGATAWMVALLFARTGAPTHLVARMQPLRTFQIVYLVLLLVLGAKLGQLVLRRSVWRWAVAAMLLGGVMLASERTAFPDSNHLELPWTTWTTPQNPWVQAFLWIRANTPKDALFALDADYINLPGEDAQCFRAITERSALPDYSKDGGEASIAPELSPTWTIAQTAQQGLSAPATTDAARMAALTPLGVSWVVLEATAQTRFDCPYSNAAVRVCRLR